MHILANHVLTITQAYWDVSGAETAFKKFINYSQTYLTSKK